jgi:LPS-assembly protein
MAGLRRSMPFSNRFSQHAISLRRFLLAAIPVLALGASLPLLAQDVPAIPPELSSGENLVNIHSDSQTKANQLYELHGHVEITYRTWKLTSDEASYDEATGEVIARGNVVFTAPESSLTAEEAHMNTVSGEGWFINGSGYIHAPPPSRKRILTTENPFYVKAKRLDRLDESTYRVKRAQVSSCTNEHLGWSISARSALVEVGDKVVSKGAMFRFLRVPLFYAPVLVNAIGDEPRRAGFLMPQIGQSGQKGFILGEGFFWPITRSMDVLVGVQNYSRRGPGGTLEFRARPSAHSEFTLTGFKVNDRGIGPNRRSKAPGQSLSVKGQTLDLGKGFRGVVDVDYVSSLAFRQIFTNSFAEAVSSETHQTGFVTKNFGAYSLNFAASRYQNFLTSQATPGNSIIIEQTPSFSFSGMDRQIGKSPFFLALDTSAEGVSRTQPDRETGFSERLDFHPTITVRSKSIWGFNLTPSVGFRATRYGTSLRPDHNPLTRLLGEFSADLRPPSFAKVFSGTYHGYRVKHVIEPDIRYRLVRAHDAEDIFDIVRFDQTDILTETNEIEYSLTNSILVRDNEPDERGEPVQARELVSWRLSQKYYFDPTFGGALQPGKQIVFDPALTLTGFAFAQGRRLSPVVSVLKLAPSSNYDTELRTDFDPSGGGILNAGVTSNLRRGQMGLSVTDFFISKTAALIQPLAPSVNLSQVTSFNLLRTVAAYGDANRRGLSGAFGIVYNFSRGLTHQVISQASYNFGCFAVDFEFLRLALGTERRENQFRISLSLANVGTFGNLKPRQRLY